MVKILNTIYKILTAIIRALISLKELTDPAVEGSPYRTNRLGRRGNFL
jgi:hypothetical protein